MSLVQCVSNNKAPNHTAAVGLHYASPLRRATVMSKKMNNKINNITFKTIFFFFGFMLAFDWMAKLTHLPYLPGGQRDNK